MTGGRGPFGLPAWVPFWAVPLAFFIGTSILFAVLKRLLGRRLPSPPAPPTAAATARGLVVFGAVFFAIGLAVFYFATLRPLYRARHAVGWPTVTGRVLASALKEHPGDAAHATTYSIDIRYAYDVAGRHYTADRYDAGGGSSNVGVGRMRAVVAAHPPGSAVVVHYDPFDPADAMLDTSVPNLIWLGLVFLVAFGGFGLAAMIYGPRFARRATRPTPLPASAAVLDSRGVRRRKFVSVLVAAIVWNAIVVTFYLLARTWFVIPFALIGVGIAAGAVFAGLAMLNPAVTVTFARVPLRAGERAEATYAVSGNFFNIRTLRFYLEGRERVSYRQGTNTRSETHVAYNLLALETAKPADMERGTLSVKLPPDAMTTFVASSNRFTWHLCCRGEIPGRPDIKDDFDVVVAAAERRT